MFLCNLSKYIYLAYIRPIELQQGYLDLSPIIIDQCWSKSKSVYILEDIA